MITESLSCSSNFNFNGLGDGIFENVFIEEEGRWRIREGRMRRLRPHPPSPPFRCRRCSAAAMVGDAARGREPTKRRERTGREDRGGERWQGERRQGERDQGRRVEDGGRDSDLKRDRVSLSEIEPHSGWNSLLHGRAHLPTTETMRDKKTNQPSCQEHQQTKLPRKPTNQAASGGRPEIEEGEG